MSAILTRLIDEHCKTLHDQSIGRDCKITLTANSNRYAKWTWKAGFFNWDEFLLEKCLKRPCSFQCFIPLARLISIFTATFILLPVLGMLGSLTIEIAVFVLGIAAVGVVGLFWENYLQKEKAKHARAWNAIAKKYHAEVVRNAQVTRKAAANTQTQATLSPATQTPSPTTT